MSLPIAGGGGGGIPTRSPTHRDIEFNKLAPLGNEVEDAADVEQIIEHPIQAVFCAGKCQSWGALDCIDRAAEIWEQRRDRKQPLFDIVARQCLDKCANAAVCEIRTPDGTAVITMASPDKVAAALKEALE